MSTLQELWYGNIRPNEELVVFEKYVDCFMEYASLIEVQVFEIGFKLALCK